MGHCQNVADYGNFFADAFLLDGLGTSVVDVAAAVKFHKLLKFVELFERKDMVPLLL